MIRYEMKNGGCFPRVFCDACSKPITSMKAIVVWSESGEIKFLHNECSRAFDHSNGFPYWEMLEAFFLYLANNTKIPHKVTKETAAYVGMFGVDANGKGRTA